MKKNIGYINLDSSSMKWLIDNLPDSELKSGIARLCFGEYDSLIIESGGSKPEVSSEMRYGTLIVNEKTRRVEQNGQLVSLTPKEYDILLFLIHNRGEVFTKEQIYNAVWDDDYVMDDSNIMAFIRKLRKKIEPNPDNPEYILTIWGIGYKFNDRI